MAPLIAAWTVACLGASVDTGESASSDVSQVLFVAETGAGRHAWFDSVTEDLLGEQCLEEAFPEACREPGCHVFGGWSQDAAPVFAYTRAETERSATVGGVLALEPGHPPVFGDPLETLDWVTHLGSTECEGDVVPPTCRLRMPHDVVRIGDVQVIADTGNDRLIWVTPEGVVQRVLDATHEDWGDCGWPNHLTVVPEGLLVTCKGGRDGEEATDKGHLALWDVSEVSEPTRTWRWPAEGSLAAVHGAVVAGEHLLYAHSRGAGPLTGEVHAGSVGLGLWQGEAPPVYLADGVGEDLGFLRSVVAEDGLLWVNDTGCERQDQDCPSPARVLAFELPELPPAERGGGWSEDHEDQVFVDLVLAVPPVLEGLQEAFEVQVWTEPEPPVKGGCLSGE